MLLTRLKEWQLRQKTNYDPNDCAGNAPVSAPIRTVIEILAAMTVRKPAADAIPR